MDSRARGALIVIGYVSNVDAMVGEILWPTLRTWAKSEVLDSISVIIFMGLGAICIEDLN